MKEIPPTPEAFAAIRAATGRLTSGLADLDQQSVEGPSRLPGWSRGHVLSHLAAQVPALERLFTWASTGVEQQQYAGRPERDAEIATGAGAPVADLVARVRGQADHFQRTIEELPAAAWTATVRPFTGEVCTPQRILVIRLRELEVHHADLDLGYELSDTPADVLDILLDDVTGHLLGTGAAPDLELYDERGGLVLAHGTGGPVVHGRRSDLLAWLAGRSPGTGLGPQPLPSPPAWI